jgi:hypothetical protein
MKRATWICVTLTGVGSLMAMAACSSGDIPEQESIDEVSGGDVSATGQAKGPVGIYKVIELDAQPSDVETAMQQQAAPGKRIIFVNKNGGTYKPGADNSSGNVSSIPSFTAKVPAYEKGAAAWSQFMTCIQDQFAPFNVEVTDVDPGNVPHIEGVMGGSPQHIGMGQGVGGVAPMNGNCSTVERAVVYIFTQVFGSPQVECEVAAQEIGHAIGMDHEYLCEDPMTYLNGCGKKKFRDQTVWCGEYSPRQCMCGGQQNSVQFMLDRLGPNGGGSSSSAASSSASSSSSSGGGGGDTTPPEVALTSPADGATLAANAKITVQAKASDDVGLAQVVLLWELNGQSYQMDCDAPPQGVTCSDAGGTYSWTIPVGSGSRTFSVRAVDSSGNEAQTEARTVSLGSGPVDPQPPPSGKPSVTVLEPTAGQAFAPGSVIPVRVTAADDGFISEVWMRWKAPSGDVVYKLTPFSATTWGIDLNLSSVAQKGNRTVRVTAYDDDGALTTHPDVVIGVQ